MVKLTKHDEVYEQARRKANAAHNDLDYYESRAMQQKSQLDGLFKYKDKCVNGLIVAKESGLTPLYMREFSLLMQHINSSIENIAYKVDISQEKYEKAKDVWQKKKEHFEVVKEAVKKNTIVEEIVEAITPGPVKKSSFYDESAITMVEQSKRR